MSAFTVTRGWFGCGSLFELKGCGLGGSRAEGGGGLLARAAISSRCRKTRGPSIIQGKGSRAEGGGGLLARAAISSRCQKTRGPSIIQGNCADERANCRAVVSTEKPSEETVRFDTSQPSLLVRRDLSSCLSGVCHMDRAGLAVRQQGIAPWSVLPHVVADVKHEWADEYMRYLGSWLRSLLVGRSPSASLEGRKTSLVFVGLSCAVASGHLQSRFGNGRLTAPSHTTQQSLRARPLDLHRRTCVVASSLVPKIAPFRAHQHFFTGLVRPM